MSAEVAPDESKATTLEKQAMRFCATGKPEEGVAVLVELFIETGDTRWIYNQGRCYEQNGLYDKAILRFEEFVGKNQEVEEAARNEARRRITTLRERLARQREDEKEQTQAATSAPATLPSLSSAAPPEAEPLGLTAAATPASPEKRPVYRSPLFWGVAGGIAVLATVTALLLLTGDKETIQACSPAATTTTGICDPLP